MIASPRNDNARGQAGGVSKAKATQLTFSFGDAPLVKPHDPDGQAGQVLRLIRERGPILNVDLKLTFGITEAGARVFELVDGGYNIIRVRVGSKFCHGRMRRGLVAYALAFPEWFPPKGGR